MNFYYYFCCFRQQTCCSKGVHNNKSSLYLFWNRTVCNLDRKLVCYWSVTLLLWLVCYCAANAYIWYSFSLSRDITILVKFHWIFRLKLRIFHVTPCRLTYLTFPCVYMYFFSSSPMLRFVFICKCIITWTNTGDKVKWQVFQQNVACIVE